MSKAVPANIEMHIFIPTSPHFRYTFDRTIIPRPEVTVEEQAFTPTPLQRSMSASIEMLRQLTRSQLDAMFGLA
jgi:hypothetical protein